MKKIHGLRRTGVLLFALGVGVLLGRKEPSISIVALCLAAIFWLLVYDFAAEKQYRKNEQKKRFEEQERNELNGSNLQ